MIELQNIQGCRVTGHVTFNSSGQISLSLKNTGPRTCIFGEKHDNNNSYLSVREDGVYYKCHSEKCEGKQEKITVPPSLFDWCAKSHEVSKRQRTTDPSTVTDTSPGTVFADTSDVMETETDTSPGTNLADTSDVMETETDTSPVTNLADTSDVMETETDTSPGTNLHDILIGWLTLPVELMLF
jgi:hypothetical protein